MLGRPFGVPNDAAFQRKVLVAALNLLERESGPVLEDFPEDAPHDKLTPPPDNLVCPVSFPKINSEGALGERLAAEVSQLLAWHDVAFKHRGRTTLGVTGLSPTAIVNYLTKWLDGSAPPPFREDVTKGDALKQACDELKAFYYESKAVQPGVHSAKSVQDWFWLETAAGQALQQIRKLAADSTDPSVKAVSVMSIVPRAVDLALQAVQK